MTDEKNDAPVGDKEFEDNTVSNFEDYNDNDGGFFAGREEYDQAPVNVTVANVHGKPIPYPVSCLLYTSPSPRDRTRSRMPSSA